MPTVFDSSASFPETASREQVLCELSRIFEERLGAESSEIRAAVDAMKTAALEREGTAPTFLGRGLAVPHGRTEKLDEIRIAVGISDRGIAWPDADSRAHLVLLLGVPATMIRDYLLLMQKILRWHKDTRTLDAAGRVVDPAGLLQELRALVA